MKFRRHPTLVKRVALGLAVAAIAAPAAQAQFPTGSAQAGALTGQSGALAGEWSGYMRALELRSQALNELYGLGSGAVVGVVDHRTGDRYGIAAHERFREGLNAVAPVPDALDRFLANDSIAGRQQAGALDNPVSTIGGAPDSVTHNLPIPQTTTAATPVVSTSGDGFDFGDAGVGFGIAAAMALLAGAAVIGLGRRDRPAIGA